MWIGHGTLWIEGNLKLHLKLKKNYFSVGYHYYFSNSYAAPHAEAGPDHVDYGAYTGGAGAFGWYTDHPVLLGAGHR